MKAFYNIGHKIMEWFLTYDHFEMVEGDLEELYQKRKTTMSQRKASWLYLKDSLDVTFRLFKKGKTQYHSNNTAMLKSFLLITLRNLSRQKLFTLINLAGLVIGFTCFILVSLYIHHELSYDRFHSKADNIHRVTMSWFVSGSRSKQPTSAPKLGLLIKERQPAVEEVVRLINYKYTRLRPTFQYEDKVLYEENVVFSDPSFFKVFDFEVLAGDGENALSNPGSMVLTRAMAERYFGQGSVENVLGKVLVFNGDTPLKVTAVLENLPSNSHIQFDFLLSNLDISKSGAYRTQKILDTWDIDWYWTYVKLKDGASVAALQATLDDIVKNDLPEGWEPFQAEFYTQPLTDVHLYSDFDYGTDVTVNSDIANVKIFALIAILILVVSVINFVNISIALATRRYKQIGISKTLGAYKSQLRSQFLLESFFLCSTAMVVAWSLTYVSLPLFNAVVGAELSPASLFEPSWIAAGMALAALVALASGMYPAAFLSSFDTVKVLRGGWKPGNAAAGFRKLLMGLQIAVTIGLITGSLVVYQQGNFLHSTNLGMKKDEILILPVRNTKISRSYYNFKNQVLSVPGVASVTAISEPIGEEVQFMTFKAEDIAEPQFMNILRVGYDFLETMELELVAGRDFNKSFGVDSLQGYILNEAAVKQFGWESPLGKTFGLDGAPAYQGKVIGVVKDFNYEPLNQKIAPVVIFFGPAFWHVAVKIKPGDVAGTIASIEKTWMALETEKPFDFYFLNQAIDSVYAKEDHLKSIFLLFTCLSVVTAMMGLIGLVSFIAEQRLPEIGIRKVFGASTGNILLLFSKEFSTLVFVSFLVAAPVSWLALQWWLDNFAYRIEMSAGYFVAGGVLALAVVLLVVTVRGFTAARVNPAETLKAN